MQHLDYDSDNVGFDFNAIIPLKQLKHNPKIEVLCLSVLVSTLLVCLYLISVENSQKFSKFEVLY